jgi:hypothetical protein
MRGATGFTGADKVDKEEDCKDMGGLGVAMGAAEVPAEEELEVLVEVERALMWVDSVELGKKVEFDTDGTGDK